MPRGADGAVRVMRPPLSVPTMSDYEKLGAFYLGRVHDAATGSTSAAPLLYDAKDLTTHAVCVGMTGSGKTGLCIGLIEEAAIDGIPVLAIDPKGDLGNLMLGFPKLRPSDFEPWIDPGEATREGVSISERARDVAGVWKRGLAEWDQGGDRIERLQAAADIAIYTPGSDAGLPLALLRSLAAPGPEMLEDGDALRERVQTAVSGLLGLLGIDAHPLRSREHILLSSLLERAWRDGKGLDLPGLIMGIQSPPMKRVGVFEIDQFYPPDQRFELAMQLNNLVASPGFSAWMEGEPLDVQKLMWTADGRPRVAILSIAHLSDDQRMFFVTLLLNEVVAWMRRQPGTSSLRALLYMDEVFGYLPPTANPPSKAPMLTLLKQARAFGLGCVLSTQNPVDLDYKALSNAGTWFLGRLQTERDKMRVLDGLEGASAVTGASFDRAMADGLLSGLGKRVFLMNNVHDREPTLFRTRWALSYLRGPLTREQIRTLMAERRGRALDDARGAVRKAMDGTAPATKGVRAGAGSRRSEPEPVARPVLPPGIREGYVPPEALPEDDEQLLYRPALVGTARLHWSSTRDDIDHWEEACLMAPLDARTASDPWESGVSLDAMPDLDPSAEDGATFAELPSEATKKSSYKAWERDLKQHLYRTNERTIWKCKLLKQVSELGESEGDFRARLSHAVRERRDLEMEKLRKRFQPKFERLQDRIRRNEQALEKQHAQAKEQKLSTVLSLGSTVLGALFGRKAVSRGTIGGARSTARGMGRIAREKGDIKRAKETLAATRAKVADLEAQFEEACLDVKDRYALDVLELDDKVIRPKKADIDIGVVRLVWVPHRAGPRGVEPLFD